MNQTDEWETLLWMESMLIPNVRVDSTINWWDRLASKFNQNDVTRFIQL